MSLRRYLPSDVTITNMHKEYNSTHTPVSPSTFYKIFETMRISMTTLGNKECEVCEKHKQHTLSYDCVGFCDVSEFMLQKKKNTERQDLPTKKM